MPDLMIRNIDHLLAERIYAFAKSRQWTINDVLLHALRRGLGAAENGAQVESLIDAGGLAPHAGAWSPVEQAVFRETVQALSLVRRDALAFVRGDARY